MNRRTRLPRLVALLAAPVLVTTALATLGATSSAGATAVGPQPAEAAPPVRPIRFPVLGPVRYGPDFGDPRSGGRTHAGNDLFAPRLAPVVAAVDGVVRWRRDDASGNAGNMLVLSGDDGWEYRYLHLNNDTPGTDDGANPRPWRFPAGVEPGARVQQGQLLGWVGDSGNAERTSPHLHFEIRTADGEAIDPYRSLREAERRPPPLAAFPDGAFVAAADVAADGATDELVAGAAPGGPPLVEIRHRDGAPVATLAPYGHGFAGGVRVAAAGRATSGAAAGCGLVATAPGPGGGPHVRLFRRCGTGGFEPAGDLFAYAPGFTGGVWVALGDVDGDDRPELVTGAGAGGGPHVVVWQLDPRSGRAHPWRSFLAYDDGFRGGVRVAVADLDGDGAGEVATAPGPGGGPHVRAFDVAARRPRPVLSLFAYDQTYRGGVHVGGGDLDGRPGDEVITGPAAPGSAHVQAWSGEGRRVGSWVATLAPWGATVAAGDLDGDGRVEAVGATGPGGRADLWLLAVPGGR